MMEGFAEWITGPSKQCFVLPIYTQYNLFVSINRSQDSHLSFIRSFKVFFYLLFMSQSQYVLIEKGGRRFLMKKIFKAGAQEGDMQWALT